MYKLTSLSLLPQKLPNNKYIKHQLQFKFKETIDLSPIEGPKIGYLKNPLRIKKNKNLVDSITSLLMPLNFNSNPMEHL